MAPLTAHFRVHGRRTVQLSAELLGNSSSDHQTVIVTNLSMAGAGLETAEPLLPAKRFTLSLTAPSRWDPLLIPAIVAWADPPELTTEGDGSGQLLTVVRAGLVFDHKDPSAALALYRVLSTLES